MKVTNSMKSTSSVFLLLFILLAAANGQPPLTDGLSSHRLTQPSPVSLSHLYWHLLEYQHHLDLAGAQHEKEGKDGTWLRTYLQRKLGFTDAEFAPIRSSADYLCPTISLLDSKAQAIAASDRQARAKGLIAVGSPPPGRNQLKALTAEREDVITAEVDRLNQSLLPEKKIALQQFITNTFVKNVTMLTIDPNKRPSHPNFGPANPASVQP